MTYSKEPLEPKVAVRYVLGFAFDNGQNHVLLIHKNRPAWQARKLNGIGGKVEEGETPDQAMVREFQEETGIDTKEAGWRYVGRRYRKALRDDQPGSFELHIYSSWLPLEELKLASKRSQTDERVACVTLDLEIIRQYGVPGLAWTVDAALCSLNEEFRIDVEDPALPDEK